MQSTYSAQFRSFVAFFFGIFFLSLCTFAQNASAQSFGVGSAVGIRLNPEFPEPGSTVEASLDAYSLDTTGASITWTLDGVEVSGSKDARSITVLAGKLGEKKVLAVTIRPVQGSAFTLRKDIVPTSVDIVVEASTYVPSFYRGRALPSADSKVRVVAIPHVGSVDPRTLTYRWEQNGSMLLGGPVRGKQSVEVTTPRYSGGYLTVSIFGADGALVTKRNIALDAVSPELHFYEENPLRGLSERAVQGNLSLIGEETTVHGEPYFFNANGAPSYSWNINGTPAIANEDPHIITLRKTGSGGTANIGLEIMSDLGIPEFLRGRFSINF